MSILEDTVYLPAALLNSNGEVDHDFLQSLCSEVVRPSSLARSLLKELGSTLIKPSESAFQVLAAFIKDENFLKKWISKTESITALPPLTWLVKRHIEARSPNLKFESLKKNGFYVHKNNNTKSYFFCLEKISILIDGLLQSPLDNRSKALFIWATHCDAVVARTKYPNEKSLYEFREAILAALKEAKLDSIIEQLAQANPRAYAIATDTPSPQAPTVLDSKPADSIHTPTSTSPTYVVTLRKDLKKISDQLESYHNAIKQLLARSQALVKSNGQPSIVQSIIDLAEGIQNEHQQISVECIDLISETQEAYHKSLEKIGLSYEIQIDSLDISQGKSWIAAFEVSLDHLLKIEESVSGFENVNRENFSLSDLTGIPSATNIEDLIDSIELRRKQFTILSTGRQVENKFLKIIEENNRNLAWNLYDDVRLSQADWINLGRYYITTRALNPILGPLVHRNFQTLEHEFAGFIGEKCEEEPYSVQTLIGTISWLTLGQLEYLATKNQNLRTLISLAQLDGYLNSFLPKQEAFAFWSAYPLSEMYVARANGAVNAFFTALYELSSTSPSELLPQNTLRLGIAGARSIMANRTDTIEELYDTVLSLLTYRRKGGGVTYAQIWEAAYETLFRPLYDLLEKSGIEAYFLYYSTWAENFDIDKHIDGWKSDIPDHLKKNSEYDKFARTQATLKKSELDHILEIYKLRRKGPAKKDSLTDLKRSVSLILKSRDKDCTLIGFWLENKIQDNANFLNPHMSLDRSTEANLGPLQNTTIQATLPRSFVRRGFTDLTLAHVYTDLIIGALGYNTAENLVEIYLDNNVLEGFSQILSTGNTSISAKLERRAEKTVEETAANIEDALKDLKIALHIDHQGRLAAAVSDIESYVDSQEWRRARSALEKAKAIAGDLDRLNKENAKKNSLIDHLYRIGADSFDSGWSADALDKRLKEFYALHEKQRAHIRIVEKLLSIENEDLRAAINNCITHLDSYSMYPDPDTSDQTAYYWEQAVDPLVSELQRSSTLLPSYKEQLVGLVDTFLAAIITIKDFSSADLTLNSIIIDTADDWDSLPDMGKLAADRILKRFESAGLIAIDEGSKPSNQGNISLPITHVEAYKDNRPDRAIAVLNAAVRAAHRDQPSPAKIITKDIVSLIKDHDWQLAKQLSLSKLQQCEYESIEDLSNWAIASSLSTPKETSIPVQAATLCLINSKVGGQVVRYLHNDRSGKALVLSLVNNLLQTISGNDPGGSASQHLDTAKLIELLQVMIDEPAIHSAFRTFFDLAFGSDSFDPVTTKWLWERLSGGTKQAEARALFMTLAWRLRSPDTLAYCLTLPPIDIEQRKGHALAQIAERALAGGTSELLQGFIDLRKSVSAKPFHLFVDMLFRDAIDQGEQPAQLKIIGDLELHANKFYKAVLKIIPRRVDSPDKLSIKLPNNAPLRFDDQSIVQELTGPFFTDTSVLLSFVLINELATSFTISVQCESTSLTGKVLNYAQELSFTLKDGRSFIPMSVDEIEDAYDNFPDIHMRGDEYVSRVQDEQKIEKALFKSKAVRSLWISSPRRSGKTTMLFRILDGYSHKAYRDSIVIYLTLDEYYSNSLEFNRWIWKRLRTTSPNRELRELYDDFDAIGRELIYDTDSGTFIGSLADQLLSRNQNASRIIVLFDEMDRFATMHFQGGVNKQAATDILWQIRSTTNDRRDIGIVFAGSSAAKQLFIASADSPFYNSIDHLELSPFSTKTKAQEELSRKIVEPQKVRMVYDLPKDSLEHLIWLCAGIPYYMKLVAGATLSRAGHSHILISDVNEGLRALLARETGISKLDDMGGEPGTDEIRTTLSMENGKDGLLAKAVLYAFAELHSPLSGHKTYRGKISSAESKLISHYNISKPDIDRGLDICIGLGLIRIVETDTVPELDFSIPILGESIRKSSGRLWANIDHELIGLANGGI